MSSTQPVHNAYNVENLSPVRIENASRLFKLKNLSNFGY